MTARRLRPERTLIVTVLKALKRVEKSLDEVVEMKDLDEKRLPLEAEGQAFS